METRTVVISCKIDCNTLHPFKPVIAKLARFGRLAFTFSATLSHISISLYQDKSQKAYPRNESILSADSTMAEPIPSASTAAADAADDETQPLPDNAEDRKAAAALSSLNANEMSQDNAAAAKQPSQADQEALGKAMSRLEIAAGGAKKTSEEGKKKEEKQKEEVVRKKIKISGEDVTFLVSRTSCI